MTPPLNGVLVTGVGCGIAAEHRTAAAASCRGLWLRALHACDAMRCAAIMAPAARARARARRIAHIHIHTGTYTHTHTSHPAYLHVGTVHFLIN
eukprot:COSAG01_NODE_659_length_14436_cov_15.108112_12_plen_94_part_00